MLKHLATIAVATIAFAPHALAETWNRLVEPAGLASLSDVTVIDIRDPEAFAGGHIPGAVNAPYPTWRGPATNPGEPMTDETLTARLQSLGIAPDTRAVVAHAGENATDFGAAARVYWTLKSAGLDEIAILNGGVSGWMAEDQPVSLEAVAPKPSTHSFTLSDQWSVDANDVADIMTGERRGTLVDARPSDFFAGERKHPAAPMGGTLATAKNAPFTAWFEGDGTKISGEDVAASIAANIETEGETVSFCNTGHWAATNWFALSELAGKEDVKLYPESVVGWIAGGGEVVKGN